MLHSILIIQPLRLNILSKEIPSEEIDELSGPVCCVISSTYAEDLVQFLKSLALGFRDKEQNAKESNKIPDRVPGEGTLGLEGFEE